MPNNTYEEFEENSAEENFREIDSRDTYGLRFSVTTRRVAGSSSKKPRAAITTNSHRMRNSDRIFTKSPRRENLGGGVNISNINVASETKLVNNNELPRKNTENVNSESNNVEAKKNKPSGLDSLFSSTTPVENPKQESQQNINNNVALSKNTESVQTSPASTTSKIRRVERSREVSEKYQAQGHNRKLKVIKPISYNSAKEVSSALKASCAVVLCLKNTNEETAKRLLDFAFGAAAMCGAKVSIEAEKTYVITIGPGLSQREKLLCVKEGVPLQAENAD